MAANESPRYHDEHWLREQYWEQDRTLEEMAEMCGVTHPTISRHMDKHGIKKRELGLNSTADTDRLRDEDWLREKYVDEQMSMREIAEIIGGSHTAVSSWLDHHGIEKKSHSLVCASSESIKKLWDRDWLYQKYVVEGKSTVEIASLCGINDTTVGQWLDRHGIGTRTHSENPASSESIKKLWDRDWLYQKYVVEGKSTVEIASLCGVHRSTVHQWLIKHSIDRRAVDPPTFVGEDHPNWNGGRFSYGPGFNDRKKRRVRIRDQARCQHCGRVEPEHLKKFGKKHTIHHITPAREIDNPEDRNSMDNLVTLCHGKCHKTWEQMAPLCPDIRSAAD